MTPTEISSVAGFSGILSSLLTVGVQALMHRSKSKAEKNAQDDRLAVHRDELLFQVLDTARNEFNAAKIEVVTLRDEVNKLRSMEEHFYHFQQALDHLEALLSWEDESQRKIAERNAKAFLARMPERSMKAFLSRMDKEKAVRRERDEREKGNPDV